MLFRIGSRKNLINSFKFAFFMLAAPTGAISWSMLVAAGTGIAATEADANANAFTSTSLFRTDISTPQGNGNNSCHADAIAQELLMRSI